MTAPPVYEISAHHDTVRRPEEDGLILTLTDILAINQLDGSGFPERSREETAFCVLKIDHPVSAIHDP
jgi:hypothetical protein